MREREIDGCYFRINRDGKWKNICFTDLTKEERDEVMEGKSAEWLASLCRHLYEVINDIADQLDLSMEEMD